MTTLPQILPVGLHVSGAKEALYVFEDPKKLQLSHQRQVNMTKAPLRVVPEDVSIRNSTE